MIKEKAYAKINLFLNVINKRFDGYHDLEMVMTAINLYDVLTFKEDTSGSIKIKSNIEITTNENDNIVYKVAELLKEEFNVTSGVEINIEKNIPIAAGLAGGSADAAAAFRGLNRLWKLKLSLDDMAKMGVNLGADIPFCIYNKVCIAKGKGEELFFINHKLRTRVLLVNPNTKISTKEVFKRVNKEDLVDVKITDMTSAIYNKNYELMARELHNSLEKISFEMEPKIREIKNQMIDLGLDGALMSGSGATVFGISRDKKKLLHALEIMNDDYYKLVTRFR
ncbi:MAG: 4-(cytidine 5'-diphospho)-2-C-methyl-D-erythritol kinase [Bacilli bacterium]|nr:4-(cytidine 5'-diphospho)-2-C-methyl-D-erythritol kinase [Bacilli bacterium]